jgi:hypothetical protein
MRRLRERQVVELGIGRYRVECRVVAINHDQAALAPLGAGLPSFVAEATLTFRHDRGVAALRGVVRSAGESGDLRFTVSDGVQVKQARKASRLPIELPVTFTRLDVSGPPVAACTTDVSATGLAARTQGLGDRGERVRVRLELPVGDPLEVDGLVARRTPWITAVRFDGFARPDEERLEGFLLAIQRALALAGNRPGGAGRA